MRPFHGSPATTSSAAVAGRASDADTPTRGLKRVGAGTAIPALVQALGGNLQALSAEAGLDPQCLAHPRNLVSVSAFGRLLHLCSQQMASPCFGLLVGATAEVRTLGLLGNLMSASETLSDALDGLGAHFQVHSRAVVLELRRHREAGHFLYAAYEPLDFGAAEAGDLALAATVKLVRDVCGHPVVPLEVRLPRRAPDDIQPYRAFFRCPVRFNEPEAVIVFHSESLRRRLPGAQPALRAVFEHMIKQREAVTPLDFEEELRRALRVEVARERVPSNTIARRFDIDRRTINRRLKASGRSFKGVADELRYMVACQLLQDTDLPLNEIAAALEFAETPPFARAFLRWSGETPGAWRNRQRDMPGAPRLPNE